jgi:energy-converting hydrogenase Eha subunit E
MSFYLFWAAAVVCLVSVYVHGVWGRKMHSDAINASEMPTLTSSVAMVAWDVFTVMLAVSGATLIFVAYNERLSVMAYPIMLMHLGGAVVFVVLAARGHKELMGLPGCYLMGATGLLIWLAL